MPTVLARKECQRLFEAMEGTARLMAGWACGAHWTRGKLRASLAVVMLGGLALAVLGVAFTSSDNPSPMTPTSLAPATLALATAEKQAPLKPALPLGISPQLYALAVPPGREPTAQLAALGEKLFKDKRLSVDDSVACETCHDPTKGFTDHRGNSATSAGVQDQHGQRNAPTVLNPALQSRIPAAVMHTVDSVRALLPQLQASIPSAINLNVALDRTPTIRASLRDTEHTLMMSIALVIMVVFMFLRNARAALIPTVALGGEIQVPTLDGTDIVKIHDGTQTGTTLRLRGKGMPDVGGGTGRGGH